MHEEKKSCLCVCVVVTDDSGTSGGSAVGDDVVDSTTSTSLRQEPDDQQSTVRSAAVTSVIGNSVNRHVSKPSISMTFIRLYLKLSMRSCNEYPCCLQTYLQFGQRPAGFFLHGGLNPEVELHSAGYIFVRVLSVTLKVIQGRCFFILSERPYAIIY